MASAPQIAWPVGMGPLAHAAARQWFAVVTGDGGTGKSTRRRRPTGTPTSPTRGPPRAIFADAAVDAICHLPVLKRRAVVSKVTTHALLNGAQTGHRTASTCSCWKARARATSFSVRGDDAAAPWRAKPP